MMGDMTRRTHPTLSRRRWPPVENGVGVNMKAARPNRANDIQRFRLRAGCLPTVGLPEREDS
jgi:hypothetical protein